LSLVINEDIIIMTKKFMRIDSHTHVSIYENNAKNLQEAFKLLLSDTKENRVDYAIVIPNPLPAVRQALKKT